MEANPEYVFIRFPNGRESTVSVRDLAPCSTNENKIIRYAVNIEIDSPPPEGFSNTPITTSAGEQSICTPSQEQFINDPLPGANNIPLQDSVSHPQE